MSHQSNSAPSDNVIPMNKGNMSPAEKALRTELQRLISSTPQLRGVTVDDAFASLCVLIQSTLDSNPDVEGITVDDILYDKDLEEVKYGAIAALTQKLIEQQAEAIARAEAARQAERQVKQGKGAKLRQDLFAKANIQPVSADALEQIKQKMSAVPAKPQRSQSESDNDSTLPDAVLELKRDPRSKRLPDLVFQEGWMAQSVRCHLVAWVKIIQGSKRDMDRAKDEELFKLYQERGNKVSELIKMVEHVISAWGLHWDPEHRDEWATKDQNKWMLEELRANYQDFFKIFHEIKLESPEKKDKRQNDEKRQKRERELTQKLAERLFTCNDGEYELSEEAANNMASRLARRKIDKIPADAKIDDELITGILMMAAINRLEVAEGERGEDQKLHGRKVAKQYANAANMTAEDLENGLQELRRQRATTAEGQSAEVAAERGAKFGESVRVPEKKKDEGGGKPSGKKGKKRQAKTDGEAPATSGKRGRK